MKKENLIPPLGIIKLEKDDVISFECILKSWKSKDEFLKSLLDRSSY